MSTPEPPTDFGKLEINAWFRLHDALVRAGTWQPHLALWLEQACVSVAAYASLANTLDEAHHEDALTEHQQKMLRGDRELARAYLGDAGLIPRGREHLGLVDDGGRDADIMAAVAPWPPEG